MKRDGYALIAVLAVMVLMVTVLNNLSRLSLRRALAASDAQIRLQQRLGSDSIERVVLPQAARVFESLEEQAEEARRLGRDELTVPTKLRDAVTIGGVTFDVVLSDEDSKLNLNQVYHAVGEARARTTINKLVPAVAARSIRLIPAVRSVGNPLEFMTDQDDEDDTAEAEIPRAFRSWGEVFDLSSLFSTIGSDAALPNLTTELTCWGSGSINIRRASDESIRSAAACVISEAGANRLVNRYRENPTITSEMLITRETKSESERQRLRRMLGEVSVHFSVWIDASAKARRSARVFSVMRRTDDGVIVNERYAY